MNTIITTGFKLDFVDSFSSKLVLRLTHVAEALHLLQDLVDVKHHVLATNHDGSIGAVPQSHMEHSPVLHMHTIKHRHFSSSLILA